MDTSYLQRVADYHCGIWWRKIRKLYPSIQETVPRAVLNNRLKTTAGRAFIKEGYIDLSTELFWEHTENFCCDTIPHELAHLAAWKIYSDPGHGKGWYTIIKTVGINTTRLHQMVNTKHEIRKVK